MSSSPLLALILLALLGGAASAAAGRAVAQSWRAPVVLFFYAFLLALVLVFLGQALFDMTPRLSGLAAAFGWTLALAMTAFRLTRARQMAVQYGFTRTPEA
jgi:hypothetical protein